MVLRYSDWKNSEQLSTKISKLYITGQCHVRFGSGVGFEVQVASLQSGGDDYHQLPECGPPPLLSLPAVPHHTISTSYYNH